MPKARQPYETIYFTNLVSQTAKDGTVVTYLAWDEFADRIYPPVVVNQSEDLNDIVGGLVKFFNGINDGYNPNLYAKNTTYITDIEPELQPIIRGLIMPGDNLVIDHKRTAEVFEPILRNFSDFLNNKDK
ncbi:MAG: hypothetical protein WDZ35_12630 [Crocinitomicaceae bacterium]